MVPVTLPPEAYDWAEEIAQGWIDWVKAAGVDVVGDLEELRPVRPAAGRRLAGPGQAAGPRRQRRRRRRDRGPHPRGRAPPRPRRHAGLASGQAGAVPPPMTYVRGHRPGPRLGLDRAPARGRYDAVARRGPRPTRPHAARTEGPVPARRPAARAAAPPQPGRPPLADAGGAGAGRLGARSGPARPRAGGGRRGAPVRAAGGGPRRAVGRRAAAGGDRAAGRWTLVERANGWSRRPITQLASTRRLRTRYELAGDPWLAAAYTAQLVADGRPPGGGGRSVHVLGTDLATMLAHTWAAGAFGTGAPELAGLPGQAARPATAAAPGRPARGGRAVPRPALHRPGRRGARPRRAARAGRRTPPRPRRPTCPRTPPSWPARSGPR